MFVLVEWLKKGITMNIQTGTIEITGLSPEILKAIDEKAREAGTTAEGYLRTWIEQEYAQLLFSPQQVEELRKKIQAGRDQITQGQFYQYASADEMMDDLEAEIEKRTANGKNDLTR